VLSGNRNDHPDRAGQREEGKRGKVRLAGTLHKKASVIREKKRKKESLPPKEIHEGRKRPNPTVFRDTTGTKVKKREKEVRHYLHNPHYFEGISLSKKGKEKDSERRSNSCQGGLDLAPSWVEKEREKERGDVCFMKALISLVVANVLGKREGRGLDAIFFVTEQPAAARRDCGTKEKEGEIDGLLTAPPARYYRGRGNLFRNLFRQRRQVVAAERKGLVKRELHPELERELRDKKKKEGETHCFAFSKEEKQAAPIITPEEEGGMIAAIPTLSMRESGEKKEKEVLRRWPS